MGKWRSLAHRAACFKGAYGRRVSTSGLTLWLNPQPWNPTIALVPGAVDIFLEPGSDIAFPEREVRPARG